MNENVNDNLRARLEEIKNEKSVNDIVNEVEESRQVNQSDEEDPYQSYIPDMSKIPRPDISKLQEEVPGGVDMGEPLMKIDVNNGTLNGKKFDESNYKPQTMEEMNPQQPPQQVNYRPQNDIPNNAIKESKKEDTPTTAEEIARRYKEKNNIIQYEEPKEEKVVRNVDDPYNGIEDGLKAIEEDSARKSAELYRLAALDAKRREEMEEQKVLMKKGIIETNDVDDIIEHLNESAAKKELDVEDEEDLTLLIQRMEEQKVYAEVVPNQEVTGPANYVIENDEEYQSNVEEILKSNGMRILKKNGKTKNAVLNRFVNSGTHVSIPLVNSGMFITMSGAGTDEIISMQQLENDTPVRMEINKLDHVCKHIIDSSVGELKLSQLLDIVSYYDKDTLYYGLYAATNPDDSEFQRYCYKCGQQYFNVIRTRDILLNPEDFAATEDDIKDNVTTLVHLVERSKLGKVYRKVHSSGMVIYVKHPSIKSYLETLQSLTDESMRLYPRIIDLAYSIDKIAIHVSGNDFMEFTDPNEILEIISKFKNPHDKYEIYDMVNEVRPNTLPTFGLKECKCPHCQTINPSQTYDMEDLIFTQAQRKEEMEAMRWAAKNQKKQKEEKERLKNA